MKTTAEQIHEASIALLADPGVRIEHDGIYDLLLEAGAKAGVAAQVVRFPRELVEESVARAPSAVQLADRVGEGACITPNGPGIAWSVPGMNLLRHGEHRLFTSSDLADWARLLDQLPGVDGVFGMSLDDVPARFRDVVGLRVMAENTRKHIRVLCFTPEGADVLCRMKPVLGAAAWFSVGFTAHGPLRWTHLALEIFSRTAGHGVPTTINGEPMAGVSAPVTLAGAAAVGNAEILAGLVVNQVLEPGRPCIYNLGLAHVFDMRTAIAVTGAPENHLLAEMSAMMGRRYELPSCSWVSTESMLPDEQAAMEKSIGYLTHLRAGVSLVWGVGQLESELTVCPAQAVIDDEILAYARRLCRGIEVMPDSLALDVVREVGVGGSFLGHDHTMQNFRDQLYEPGILCRQSRQPWAADGGKRLAESAEEKADTLIAAVAEPCVGKDEMRELRKIEETFMSAG